MDQVLVDLFSHLNHPVFAWLFTFFIAPYFGVLWYFGWLGLLAGLFAFGGIFFGLYRWLQKRKKVSALGIIVLFFLAHSSIALAHLVFIVFLNSFF